MEQLLKLQDVCIAKTSNITQNSLSNENGEYPIYGASGLIKNIGFYQQDKEYIAIVKDGSGVGRVSLHPAYSSVIGTMQYIIPDNNIIDTKFLFHYLKHLDLSKYSVGMAIPHIYFKDYKNEALNVPSLEIQKEKSKTLDNLVKLIDIKEQILKKYDDLVKSQFIEMFENRFDKEKIKEHCDIVGGFAFKSKDIIKKGIKLLQISNVYHRNIDWTIENNLPKDFYEKYSNFTLKENDIVIALTRPIIQSIKTVKMGIVKTNDLPCLLNQRVCKITNFKNTINNIFLYSCLENENFTNYVQANCKGSSQPNISTKDIENYQIPLPPIELQNQFADFVKHIDKLKYNDEFMEVA